LAAWFVVSHLLLHVYPFFFDQRSHIRCNDSQPCPSSALPHHNGKVEGANKGDAFIHDPKLCGENEVMA
jgi:hypothetical protein